MADAPIVHIGENSPEHVAYQLLRHVATAEQKSLTNHGNSRKWILDTYSECLEAVRGFRQK